MKILITNDDGIDSYGLKLLESLAKTLTNNITTVAPRDNRSGTSQAISLQDELYFSILHLRQDCFITFIR